MAIYEFYKRGIRVYVKGKTAWLMLWLKIESDASSPSAALSITSLLLPGYFSVRNVSVVQSAKIGVIHWAHIVLNHLI